MLFILFIYFFKDYDPVIGRLKSTRKVVTESMRHGLSSEAVTAEAFVQVYQILLNLLSLNYVCL